MTYCKVANEPLSKTLDEDIYQVLTVVDIELDRIERENEAYKKALRK